MHRTHRPTHDSKGFSGKFAFCGEAFHECMHTNPICTSPGRPAVPRIFMRIRSYGIAKLLSHLSDPPLTVILPVQTHYRYENARRNRVYGKRIPNTRVDTSQLADRVRRDTITFLEIIRLKSVH
jgi:hypothetical protein